MICRRAFIAAVAVAIVLAPFGAKPQQAGKVARIGFLSNVAVHAPLLAAFRQGLHERGYVEGQNIQVEYRSADGSYERLLDLAAELVRLEPDLIVAAGTPAPIALKRVTSTIP